MAITCLQGCFSDGNQMPADEEDTLSNVFTDSVEITLEEEIYEEESTDSHLDDEFVDFLFTFIHSKRLLKERIIMPLIHIDTASVVHRKEELDAENQFVFLKGDFFTMLYSSVEEIDRLKNERDSIVYLDHIRMEQNIIQSYEFQHRQIGWTLVSMRDITYEQSAYMNFIPFYNHFVSDSTYQQQCIAQPLYIKVPDPEDENEIIEGTIDADQWYAFGAELPTGELTNIRCGQHYNGHRMVLVKSGVGYGLQEIYTFEITPKDWRLVSFEH